MSCCRIIVFSRKPELGKVKTRIEKKLGKQQALAIHQTLLQRTLDMVGSIGNVSVCVYCSPDCSHPLFTSYAFDQYVQRGDDLGQRMHNALTEQLRHYDRCVLIGTDCPQMDEKYLQQAFIGLKTAPVIFGAAEDGGYVLVGLTQPQAAVFNNIQWGSDQVLRQSCDILDRIGTDYLLLPALRDIDEEGDWLWWQSAK